MLRNTRKEKNSRNNIPYMITVAIIGIIAAAFISHSGWDPVSDLLGLNKKPTVDRPAYGDVQVHFIDVGQGDCTLILAGDKAVLIDSGDVEYADSVVQYIKSTKVDTIDLIIASHLHADHMGGMDKIIAAVKVNKLIMPRIPDSLVPTSNVFMRMTDAIEKHSVAAEYAEAGGVFDLGGAFIEILAPDPAYGFDDLNNSSIAAKLTHGENTFLFTGDVEEAAEEDILSNCADVSAKVLKVAHHGSKTSSSRAFLEAVGGTYALIGVGSPNRYNHPSEETVKRLNELGYEILRTDDNGTIVFESSELGALSYTLEKNVRRAA